MKRGGLWKRMGGAEVAAARDQSYEQILAAVRTELVDHQGHLLEAAHRDPGQRVRLREVTATVLIQLGLVQGKLPAQYLAYRLMADIVGYGPLEELLNDAEVTEVMVNGASEVYVERAGTLHLTDVRFTSDREVVDVISRIIGPLGKKIDLLTPFVDARLPDGSRVHAIIPPLSVRGPALTIRRFSQQHLTLHELTELGTITSDLAKFLREAMERRCNIIVTGGTGSGKTTTLAALLSCLTPQERIVAIEDTTEIDLSGHHLISLETRAANLEGKGEVTMRQLVRNALRMRPDRLVVGECRGGEAFDMLQAMNTGHDGSLSTLHANGPADALARLASMVMMADSKMPHGAVIDQIRSAVDLLVHQAREGSRRVVQRVCLVVKEAGERIQLVDAYTSGSGLLYPETSDRVRITPKLEGWWLSGG
ncbi:MAG: CpaF family protein [Bacillota bacterium]